MKANQIENGKALLEKKHKHKHYSQATIRAITKSDLQQFLLWYDETALEYQNNRFVLSEDEEIVIYPNIGYCHYTGKTYTPIEVLVEVLGLTYQDTLYLLNYFFYKVQKQPYYQAIKEWSAQTYSERLTQKKNTTLDLDTILAEDLFSNEEQKAYAYKRVIAYLCDTRHIDKDIVLNFISQGFLKMDNKGNLAFVTYADPLNKREVIAIAKKGTTLKRFCPNYVKEPNEGFFFAYKENLERRDYKELYVFESAVDLLSFLTLTNEKAIVLEGHDPNCGYASMNGAGNHTYVTNLLTRYPSIQKVNIGLDNDTKGIDGAASLARLIELNYPHVQAYDMRPDGLKAITRNLSGGLCKDWNDVLSKASGGSGPLAVL